MAGAVSPVAAARSRHGAHLTTPPAVGLGTLRRLAALAPGHPPVLSVYIALEECARGACEPELLPVVGELPQTLRLGTVDRVSETLRALPAFPHGTRAIALFFAADGAELELVPLPEQVATTAVCDGRAWLEPLLGICGFGERGAESLFRPRRSPQPAPALTETVSGNRLEAVSCL